jgi:ribosomal protein S18 acetylase RimI-like enzyme
MNSPAKTPKIKYISGNEDLLNEVRRLWEKLNKHHLRLSPNFKPYYAGMTFPKRNQTFLQKAAKGEMRVDIAVDEAKNRKVGYCISSLDVEQTGEIESIYVLEAYRGMGIGDKLMKSALLWMQTKQAAKKIVIVGAGNEQAFGFYDRYGFRIRKTMLEQT